MNYKNHRFDDSAPLPGELYTPEELEEMELEARRADDERSIPTPADRNPRLR